MQMASRSDCYGAAIISTSSASIVGFSRQRSAVHLPARCATEAWIPPQVPPQQPKLRELTRAEAAGRAVVRSRSRIVWSG
jgi:hypothetical protein